MCVSPIRIKNPNYGSNVELIQKTCDTKSHYINVPCGVCVECLMKRQMDLVQRVRVLSLDHFIFFCTLTYSSDHLRRLETSTGFSIPYADHTDIIKMCKRIRKGNLFGYPFHYYFVTERGSEKGRPHVHGLIFIKKPEKYDSIFPAQLESSVRKTLFHEWRRNYGSTRVPDWKPLFKYRSKIVAGKRIANFDCHYVTSHSSKDGEDDVAFYVTKYVLKPSKKEQKLQQALKLNLPPDEFLDVWKIVKSRSLCSKRFGLYTDLEKAYVTDCINRSSSDPDGFKFFTLAGKSQPVARYYRRLISPDAAVKSVAARGGPITFDDRSMDDKVNSVEKIDNFRAEISSHDLTSFID